MKNFKNIILGCAVAAALISCKKELDLQPTDTFSDANAFITMDDVQQGVNGAFGRYGARLNDIYVSALLSDEARLGSSNAGQGALTYRYQYSSDATTGGDVTAAWGSYYSLIDQCNRVLPHVDRVTATPAEEARRPILKAHLLGLRALGHYGLLINYAKAYDYNDPMGVPLMVASNPTGYPARNSVGVVMDQIIADLAEAKSLLPNVTTAADFSDTVLNKVNIAAHQARIALYRKDYDQAITFATEVINSGVKTLASTADFPRIWTDQSREEVLFLTRYETSNAVGALFTTTGGDIYIAPSEKLRNSYAAGDVRRNAYIGVDGNGNVYLNKYFESSRGGRVVHMKNARIAEMYLIRAEANARKSSPDLTAAAADLNLLRSARITGYTDETFANAQVLIDAIMTERFKELAFEGFRFYDLKRNGMPVERSAADANPEWQTLPADSYRFTLPVPRDEINANPNITPTPGYN